MKRDNRTPHNYLRDSVELACKKKVEVQFDAGLEFRLMILVADKSLRSNIVKD